MRPPLSFRQQFNHRVELDGGTSYRYGGGMPKPCVHPLLTPAGTCLSGFQMSDHPWHRGVWFAIKLVNGTNFWEEDPVQAFGSQVSRTEPQCELPSPDVLRVTHRLDWTSRATGTLIEEIRVITFREASLDWSAELRAVHELTLDRTPFTTWGGYGGLSFRSSRELHDVSFLIPGGETVGALAGQRHDWCVMQASVDGGPPERRVSIGLIDHPSNPRSPSPWYCKSGNGFNFLNAAFIFHEPMTVPRGRALRFRYRILFRDGTWPVDEFAALADSFRMTEKTT